MAANTCPPLTVYSFENVVCTLDGREVVGLWEGDDAIMIERIDDLGTPLTGADGASVVSISANETANVTLKLMPNSAMNAYLNQVVRAMRAGSQRVITFSIRDTSNGEGGGCSAAIVIKEPSNSFGRNATSRDWVLFCSCWQVNDIIYTPVAA